MMLYISFIFVLIIDPAISEDILSKFVQNDYLVKDYLVTLESFDPRYVRHAKIVTFKYNRTVSAVNVSFNLRVDAEDKVDISVQVYKFLSNEYRHFPIRLRVNLNKAFLADAGGIRGKCTCGNVQNMYFKKDTNYTVCNFVIDETKFPPLIPNGRYKIQTNVTYLNEAAITLNSYGEVYRPVYVAPKRKS